MKNTKYQIFYQVEMLQPHGLNVCSRKSFEKREARKTVWAQVQSL